MKELKFRVWDEKFRCWDKDAIILYPGEELVKQGRIIQQFTGIEDKNGREIYDGDVIKYRGTVGNVDFFAGSFRWTPHDDQIDIDLGSMITLDMEVLGHICD